MGLFSGVGIVLVLVVLAVVAALARNLGGRRSRPIQIQRKQLMTPREQATFNRLSESLPWAHVLAQVSFGALLKTEDRAARNTFDRKIADFVVCDKSLKPVAIIELDDASHTSKRNADQKRDDMLKEAGYRVIRYRNVPDIAQVQSDLVNPIEAQKAEVIHAKHNEPT